MAIKPAYPDIEVELIGKDGNAFAIISRVTRALRRARVPEIEINSYVREAVSGDYAHLLKVTMDTVTVKGMGNDR